MTTMYILDPKTAGYIPCRTGLGKLNWTFDASGPIRCSPKIAEGHIFIGSDDGNMYAVNILSSRRTWKVETGSPIRSSPFITSDHVYFGTEDGEMLCVDFRGTVKWRFRARRANYSLAYRLPGRGLLWIARFHFLCIRRQIRVGHLALSDGKRISVLTSED